MNEPATNVQQLRRDAKMPAKQAGGSTVAQFFQHNKDSIRAVLPQHVNPDRMLKIALGALRTTPKLMECTTESLFGAVVQCAQLGLEPNTPMGHAYMIPFKNRRENRTDVQVIVGYRGLLDLARRSGQIVSIAAHAVHEHDQFDFAYGLDEKLVHRPASGDRGEVTHFYAVAKLEGGGHAFEVMTRADIEAIRDASQNHQSAKRFNKPSVWDQHFVEMGRKTAIRRLFKYLPVSIEMATAAALDGAAEAGQDQNMAAALSGEWTVVSDDAPANDLEALGDDSAGAGADPAAAPAPTWPEAFTDEETGEQGWVDSAGEYFDPTRHAMSDSGVPAVKQDGSFRARRGTVNRDDTPPAGGDEGDDGGNDDESGEGVELE